MLLREWMWQQARGSTTEERVGRRACLCYAVSDTDRPVIHLQLHRDGATRDSVLACSYLVAAIDPPWSDHHPPQEKRIVPVREALQGSPHHIRSVSIYI